MSRISLVILAIFFISGKILFAQNSKWENFTDFKNVTAITSDPATSNLYCGSSGGLFVVEAATGKVLNKYTNLDGLISNDILSMTIDNNHRLWIGASDGSISILNTLDNSWKYIFDIKNSTESNKAINFIYPSGNFMFVATGYGIQKISATNFNFLDAPYYKLGGFPNNSVVYSLTVLNNVLYAATKFGVAYANYTTSNLNNPASWINYNSVPLNSEVKTIETFDNKVFAGSLTGFSYFDGNAWSPYPNPTVSNQNTKFIESSSDKLYFISNNTVYFSAINDLSNISVYLNQSNYTTLNVNNTAGAVAGLSDNGVLLKFGNDNLLVFPNSPFTNFFNQVVIDADNNIWASGGTPASGFYMFNGSVWENYNTSSHPEIGPSNWFQKIAFGCGNVWALGFGGGPTFASSNPIRNYNTTNSTLPGIPADPLFCASSGGAYDNNCIFWSSFFNTNSGRSLFAFDGTNWIGISNPSFVGTASLNEIGVDSYNTKWVTMSGSRSGVYFFNENTTLNDPLNDIYGFYDNSDFGSEVTNVNDVIVDKNNEVWIATNNGIFIINNPFAAIQNPNQKPPAQKLGIISGNLKVPFTENCITLTNDILNSKWIGTETNGVFHLSADGSTLIEQLNTAKTPILSNKVTSIAVSNKTGRAYFGTQKGLSSYATDAIEPVADFDELIASPNPFVVPSDASMKIDGLIENSIIKIITLSGEIVTEFDSPGGRIATWDGRNKNNQFASTGIYIIVAYNEDGSKVGTGKVAIVNK